MDRIDTFIGGLLLGLIFAVGTITLVPSPTQIKYIYDTEARLVGFCSGKYLIRTEEDEFPKSGCMFIEPISLGHDAASVWEGGTDVR